MCVAIPPKHPVASVIAFLKGKCAIARLSGEERNFSGDSTRPSHGRDPREIDRGIAAALGLTRFLASFLFGAKPSDPLVFLLVPILLSGVASLAVWPPALRASRADPTEPCDMSSQLSAAPPCHASAGT